MQPQIMTRHFLKQVNSGLEMMGEEEQVEFSLMMPIADPWMH